MAGSDSMTFILFLVILITLNFNYVVHNLVLCHGLWSKTIWLRISSLLLMSCVTLGRLFNLSVSP